jgi:hypothetical protein
VSASEFPIFSDILSVINSLIPHRISASGCGPVSGKSTNQISRIIISTELRLSLSPSLTDSDLILIPQITDDNLIDDIHSKQIESFSSGVNIHALPLSYGSLNRLLWNKLGDKLGLKLRELIRPVIVLDGYKLVVFVPRDTVDILRTALSKAGAGIIGNYTECSFSTKGEGTYIPGEGAEPYIGEQKELSRVEEIKLEMVLPSDRVEKAIEVLNKVHPYEEPAYDLYPVHSLDSGISNTAIFKVDNFEKFRSNFGEQYQYIDDEIEPSQHITISLGSTLLEVGSAIFDGEGLFLLNVNDDITASILDGAGISYEILKNEITRRLWLDAIVEGLEDNLVILSNKFSIPETITI